MSRLASFAPLALLVLILPASPARSQLIEVEVDYSYRPHAAKLWTLSLPDPLEVPDLASSLGDDPCDLSALPPDGEVNADDIICRLWGGGDPAARDGLFTLSRIDSKGCGWLSRTAMRRPGSGRIEFLGTAFAYEPEVGYVVQVGSLPGQPAPENRTTLRSRCNLSLPPRVVTNACRTFILAVPYDAVRTEDDEILCGERGVDWFPDAEGRPVSCPAGLFDPDGEAWVAVQRFDSERGAYIERVVVPIPEQDRLVVFGPGFHSVPPGEAVFFHAQRDAFHGGRTWAPATAPCP